MGREPGYTFFRRRNTNSHWTHENIFSTTDHQGNANENHSEILLHICQKGSHQFNSVAQSCPTLCNFMDCSIPGLPVHHQLLAFTETHVY